MTGEAESLHRWGALRSLEPSDQLCSACNIDRELLESYVRCAVDEFVPPLAKHEMAPAHSCQRPVPG